MTVQKHDHRCKGQTKSGNPCRAAATESGLCFFHTYPRASELGQIGGRRNSATGAVSFEPLATVDNPVTMRDVVAQLIEGVYSGKVHPRVAAGLAPLLNLQLRVIESTDLERRLADVEKQLVKADK